MPEWRLSGTLFGGLNDRSWPQVIHRRPPAACPKPSVVNVGFAVWKLALQLCCELAGMNVHTEAARNRNPDMEPGFPLL